MKLSELNTGDKACIIKVKGHGGFRKRIVAIAYNFGRVLLLRERKEEQKRRTDGGRKAS